MESVEQLENGSKFSFVVNMTVIKAKTSAAALKIYREGKMLSFILHQHYAKSV